jgi:hypothetical protein
VKNPRRLSLARRAGFWLIIATVTIRADCDRALAQSPAVAPVPAGDESAAVARPSSTPQPYNPTAMSGADESGDPSAGHDFPAGLFTPDPETTNGTGLVDRIRESMFAKRDGF